MSGHEIHRFGIGEFGGDHQVAFVFPVFVIDKDEHLAVARVGDDVFDRGNRLT